MTTRQAKGPAAAPAPAPGDAARPAAPARATPGSAFSAFFRLTSKTVLEAAREPRREDVQQLRQRADGRPRQEGQSGRAQRRRGVGPRLEALLQRRGPLGRVPKSSTTSAATLRDFPRSSESSVNARTSQRA